MKKGDFENPKVMNCNFSTKSVPNFVFAMYKSSRILRKCLGAEKGFGPKSVTGREMSGGRKCFCAIFASHESSSISM